MTIWGRKRWGWGLFVDESGVTVRTHRYAWAEISRLEDSRHVSDHDGRSYWELLIVLRTGRAIPVSRLMITSEPGLTALLQAAERHAVPAEVTMVPRTDGRPAKRGLYEDPWGQPGLRYWDGIQWSPLLPPEFGKARRNAKDQALWPSQRSWSSLPVAEGSWTYAAACARRFATQLAVIGTASAAMLTWGVIELARSMHHGHLSGGLWLFFAAAAAYLAIPRWAQRKFFLKLDDAANGPLGIAGDRARAVDPSPYRFGTHRSRPHDKRRDWLRRSR
jgi:hypothetical protein